MGRIRTCLRAEKYLKDVLENLPNKIILIDRGLHILWQNRICWDDFDIFKVYTSSEIDAFFQHFNKEKEQKEGSYKAENEQKLFSINEKIFEISHYPLYENSKTIAIVFVVEDITSLKGQNIFESEANYRNLVENAQDIIYRMDIHGNYLFLNKAFENILGYRKEKFYHNRRIKYEIVHPEDIDRVKQEINKILTKEKYLSKNLEFRVFTKDGRMIWLSQLTYPILDENSKVLCFEGIVRDVTEEKAIKDEITSTKKYLQNLIESCPDPIIALNEKGEIAFANHALQKTFGFQMGENASHYYKGGIEEARNIMKLLTGNKGEIINHETIVTSKTGRDIPVLMSASLLTDKKGNITGTVGFLKDMTERKELENLLARSKKLASLGEIAASIAHEIRNPLGAISNSITSLRQTLQLIDQDDQRLMEIMVEEAERLNEFLKEFVNLARVEKLVLTWGKVTDVIDKTLLLIKKDKRYSPQIEINTYYAKGIPKVLLDEKKMSQVFLNLFMNSLDALKGKGKIDVSVRPLKRKGEQFLEISISDNGPGISRDKINLIFEPFFTTKSKGSMGLGLSVVQRIIDLHHGSISVKSEEGSFTTFSLLLPIKKSMHKTCKGR